MKIFFIADAHLKGTGDPNQALLCSFLSEIEEADKLVILGDLFDFWIGANTVAEDQYRPVLDRFEKLVSKGVEIIYLEGNHDFNMGDFFTETLKARVATGELEITLDKRRFCMTHGDIVSPTPGYALWRWFLRSSFFKVLSTLVPDSIVWRIAYMLSNKSRGNHYQNTSLERRQRAYARRRIEEGSDVVVLAHTHVPVVLEGLSEKSEGTYLNPGGWTNSQSYATYDNGNFKTHNYKGKFR